MTIARKLFHIHISAVMNMHATIKELLKWCFICHSCQGYMLMASGKVTVTVKLATYGWKSQLIVSCEMVVSQQ
jgi:hypothetical protein